MQGAIFGGEKGERMEIYIGTPNERQKEFLRCEKKYIAFGGARGGGKSWAVRCKAKLLALRYPGIRLLLVRRTLPEIEANHLTFLRRELAGAAAYRAGERRFVFANGSSLQFGYKVDTEGYIRTGIVYYDGAVPVYGVAVGQDLTCREIDGQRVVEQSNFRAVFTASRLSFWQDATEVAYVSNNRLYITNITVLGAIAVGQWSVEAAEGGLAFRWIGG